MYIYIALMLMGFFPLLVGIEKFNKYNLVVWYFIMPLILCFGYMTGTDWVNYEKEWDLINVSYYNPFVDGYEEPGYWVLCFVFKSLGLGFWTLNITIKLIGYYVFVNVYRFFNKDSTWGLMYAFVFWMLNSLINFPARNFCAWIIFIISLKYIVQRKLMKYILLCSLAVCFHISILMVVPIYFLRFKLSSKFYNLSIIPIIIFLVLYSRYSDQIWELSQSIQFLGIADRTESFADGTFRYMDDIKRTSFSFGFVARVLVYLLAVRYRREIISKYKYGDFIINMSLVVVFYDSIVTVVPLFNRAVSAVVIMYCVVFAYVMKIVRIQRTLKSFVAFVFLLLFMLGTVTNYIYVPYSNYLEYTFKDKPSYGVRVNYNKTHTPYKEKL